MKKLLILNFLGLIYFVVTGLDNCYGQVGNSDTEITYGKSAPNISRITKDTLVISSGSTYAYTVDTPEGEGLVATSVTAKDLFRQISSKGALQHYLVTDADGKVKKDEKIKSGDRLIVTTKNNMAKRVYYILVQPGALAGRLILMDSTLTVNATRNLTINYSAGQRSPDATVSFYLPAGIVITRENTTVNIIGRGAVKLSELASQSIGRTGSKYSYKKVGEAELTTTDGNPVLILKHLDLRPDNGIDIQVTISNVSLKKTGTYQFKAICNVSKPEKLTSPGTGNETTTLTVTNNISGFKRIPLNDIQYKETPETYITAKFKWDIKKNAVPVTMLQSLDKGKSWSVAKAAIDLKTATATVANLKPSLLYMFRLVETGLNRRSNTTMFFTGKMDVKQLGVSGKEGEDQTDKINEAINYMHNMGGGTLLFSKGTYPVRTIHLQSNVYLYVGDDAEIKALKGGDAPETTWFSDLKYRSGLSPTDNGPYADPENYMTKQDVGHHYFKNAMFFGERIDNVKIIGTGLVTGDGNLVNSDGVMKNAPDNRCDKMFSLKLCTNLEIGGIDHPQDLWYDEPANEPYYIQKDGKKFFDTSHMLKIERGGHFALLATGTDGINVHDTYFGKTNRNNVRDIYDFMECNHVMATNIFSRISSDDVIKPGSDCSLGFTRPVSDYRVRNIIGDTNCNLIQIGSETADDIKDVYVDNVYVLGANKAGFSISTNDGAHVSNVHLNSGKTGTIHSRSKMYRATTPVFISISNRGRIIGAEAGRYSFMENGKQHDELLIKNVNIGQVDNISLKGIDIYEVYAGSAYNSKIWKPYDGSQRRLSPIIAGYKLPYPGQVTGGLDFHLPDGRSTGYISKVTFDDVNVLVKGGNPASDTLNVPDELSVGKYNAADLKVQPSYGIWARHVKGLTVTNSSFNYEKTDNRYPVFLEDVLSAIFRNVTLVKPADNIPAIKLKGSSDIRMDNMIYLPTH
ncbi:endopygalactorunase [Mucilaginibacter boryungensis]|uniref:Endopygalactorunase n=1 Tax=Mucilaginibacter boryungensis TaxID=768480 RepID=A0ABR9XKW4_9SPHI|nr:endopygalactorunase [Mucilaginibacter boryungensis]MBE9668027.1 endopygalactorunase [Mucilaginibacter boryungensis]